MRRKHRSLIMALFGLIGLSSWLRAQDVAPRLVVDPQGHSSIVNDLLFTPDGETLVSLGDDKAIRVWDVESGELRQTLRLQMGDGPEGALYAGALSPDGRFLAVGGYDENDTIRIIDRENAEVAAVLTGHSNVILELAFFAEGRGLVSCSSDESVRVWDLNSLFSRKGGPALRIEKSIALEGHTAKIYSVSVTPDGNSIVSGSYDETLRLWVRNRSGGHDLSATIQEHGENAVTCVRISPDGKLIASGGRDNRLLLCDGASGRLVREMDSDMEAQVSSLAFSSDGSKLFAASADGNGEGYTAIYNVKTGNQLTRFDHHSNTVNASAWSPIGNLVASAGGHNNEIYLWRPENGEVVHELVSEGRTGWAVAFGNDEAATRVAFGQTADPDAARGENRLEKIFDFTALTLTSVADDAGEPDGFRRFVHHRGGQELVEDGDYGLHTGSGVIEYDPERNHQIRCYSYTESSNVVVGTSSSLDLYSVSGELLREFAGHESIVWGASPSADDKYLASVSKDQTVRLWNMQTGDLLVSLFAGTDGEWVCWTPDGYFSASPDGGRYLGWHFNRGVDKIAGFLAGEQLYDHYYRPDIVKKVVAENRPSHEVAAELGLVFDPGEALRGAPIVSIAGTENKQVSPNRRLSVMVEGIDNGGGLSAVRLFHDDKRLSPDGPGSFRDRKYSVPYTVSLRAGENKLRAVALNVEGIESRPEQFTIRFEGEVATSRLHILAVGLNKYKNPRFELNYCRPDVESFVTLFLQQSKDLFSGESTVHQLFDENATRKEIQKRFKLIAESANPEDVFIFVYAGHGVMSEGTGGTEPEFHLVPFDVTQMYGDDEALAEKAISTTLLEKLAASIPAGKQLMFLDACQSGGLVESFAVRGATEQKAIAQLSRATGMHIMSSTRTEQFAAEVAELGHGLFTFAVLEGLKGKADANSDGRVTVKEVEVYVNERVPELSEKHTGTAQYPNSFGRGQDFPLGLVK